MIHRARFSRRLQAFYATVVSAAICCDFFLFPSRTIAARVRVIEAGTPPVGERALIVSGILVALGILAFLLNALRQRADIRRGLNDAGKDVKSR